MDVSALSRQLVDELRAESPDHSVEVKIAPDVTASGDQRLVRILNTFLGAVSAAIEAHGGVVEEYMGDGAKALFAAFEVTDFARNGRYTSCASGTVSES